MLQKATFYAVGHCLSVDDCRQISELITREFNLRIENSKLQSKVAELQSKLKVKVFQLDLQTVIVIAPDENIYKLVKLRSNTVEIKDLE